jgi:hypothetical protein
LFGTNTICSILAVVPCNVDIATQTILQLAKEVDPDEKRTLGVLTKPDLVIETAIKQEVASLVEGKRGGPHLGYCVAKNRGADDSSSSLEDRDRAEQEFFSHMPWANLDKTRLGIPALRARLRELLMDRTKSEFPKVKRDILNRLKDSKQQLEGMGPSRSSSHDQRAFLGKIALRFMDLKNFGLDAYYTGDPLFTRRPELKLITRIREINEAFATLFFEKAHSREFTYDEPPTPPPPSKREEPVLEGNDDAADLTSNTPETNVDTYSIPESITVNRGNLYPISFEIPADAEDDLDGILADPFSCPDPEKDGIMEHIKNCYLTSRGYDLGTVSTDVASLIANTATSKTVTAKQYIVWQCDGSDHLPRTVEEVGSTHSCPRQQRDPHRPSIHS